MQITKDQFKTYLNIRDSGVTNMWDTKFVSELSVGELTRDDVVTIIKNFSELVDKYGDPRNG